MPNQRDPEKRMLALYIHRDMYEKFRKLSELSGITMTAFVQAFIIDQINKYEREHGKLK